MKPKDYPQKINLEELMGEGWISFGKGSAVGLNEGYLELLKKGRKKIIYNSKLGTYSLDIAEKEVKK